MDKQDLFKKLQETNEKHWEGNFDNDHLYLRNSGLCMIIGARFIRTVSGFIDMSEAKE